MRKIWGASVNEIILNDLDYIYNSKIINWKRFQNKTVLITGAYGMLASYMVYMLIYLNEYVESFNVNIVTVARNQQKFNERFLPFAEKEYFRNYSVDICKNINIEEKIDFVIHAASPASSQYYNINPLGVIMPNVLGTINTLNIAKRDTSEGYLFFSSGEIYGATEKENIRENDLGYLNCLDVRSCYGESKRMGENLCKCFYHQHGVNAKIVRPCHTYGPTMNLQNDNRVFAEFVANVVNNQDIMMKSDGSAQRIFCYIADATLAFFKVLLDGDNGEAYNVTDTNSAIKIKDLAYLIAKINPSNHYEVICSSRKDENYLENKHILHSIPVTDKLERLGWKPNFTLETGFMRTIKSFK